MSEPRVNAMGHVPVIDSLRGIAASMVCFYHFVCTTKDYIYNELTQELFHFGYYGVHVFFVISGIVIPLSMIVGGYTYGGWFQFIKKRFIRIEPPYLFSIGLALAYLIGRNFIPGTSSVDLTPDLTTVALHIGYLIPFFDDYNWMNNVYWSLAVEFQYYLFLCLVFPLMISVPAWKRLLTYPLFFFAALTTVQTTAYLPLWLPMFMVGISYVLYRFDYIKITEFAILLVASLFFTWYYIDLNAVLFGLGTLSLVHFAGQMRNAITKFFGRISYSLYLIHTIVGSAFINYCSHIYREPWQKPIVIILGFAVAVICSYIMYLIIEKPSKRWASRIKF